MSKLFLILLVSVFAIGAEAGEVGDAVNCPPKNPGPKQPKDAKSAPGSTNLLLCLPPKAKPMTKAQRDEAQRTDEWQRQWAGVPSETWNKMSDAEKAQRKQDEWQRKWTGLPKETWARMTDAEKAKAFDKAKAPSSKDTPP